MCSSDLDMNRTREPLQIGAEIYGHRGVESDIEVQRLMMQAMAAAGVKEAHLDLGHVAIFRALVRRAKIDDGRESELFRAMQLKDVPALRALTAKLDRTTREALTALPDLYGGRDVLAAAARRLPAYPEIRDALRDLKRLSDALADVAKIRFDLA